MRTEDLIAQLSAGLTPLPRNAVAVRLGVALAAGGAASLALLLLWLGLRPDLAEAAGSAMFWMKLTFTVGMGAAALLLVGRLGRPESRVGAAWAWLGAPVVVAGLIAMMPGAQGPAALAEQLWTGRSALLCPVRIAVLSAPVFIALVLAFRRLAPTRLAAAGFGAGVLAGCTGATVYALYCREGGLAFLAVWYTLGVAATGGVGALLGPRLLRW